VSVERGGCRRCRGGWQVRALRLERGDFELIQFTRDGQQYELRIEVGGAASSVRAHVTYWRAVRALP
jgi:hypothetical protein